MKATVFYALLIMAGSLWAVDLESAAIGSNSSDGFYRWEDAAQSEGFSSEPFDSAFQGVVSAPIKLSNRAARAVRKSVETVISFNIVDNVIDRDSIVFDRVLPGVVKNEITKQILTWRVLPGVAKNTLLKYTFKYVIIKQ